MHEIVGSIFRTLPKNSVTNTFLISLLNKSVRYETVEMHLCVGQQLNFFEKTNFKYY